MRRRVILQIHITFDSLSDSSRHDYYVVISLLLSVDTDDRQRDLSRDGAINKSIY